VLARAGVAKMIASHDLFWFEHGDHVHARSAHAHSDKPAPGVRIWNPASRLVISVASSVAERSCVVIDGTPV
jgi:hypothetical protein